MFRKKKTLHAAHQILMEHDPTLDSAKALGGLHYSFYENPTTSSFIDYSIKLAKKQNFNVSDSALGLLVSLGNEMKVVDEMEDEFVIHMITSLNSFAERFPDYTA